MTTVASPNTLHLPHHPNRARTLRRAGLVGAVAALAAGTVMWGKGLIGASSGDVQPSDRGDNKGNGAVVPVVPTLEATTPAPVATTEAPAPAKQDLCAVIGDIVRTQIRGLTKMEPCTDDGHGSVYVNFEAGGIFGTAAVSQANSQSGPGPLPAYSRQGAVKTFTVEGPHGTLQGACHGGEGLSEAVVGTTPGPDPNQLAFVTSSPALPGPAPCKGADEVAGALARAAAA